MKAKPENQHSEDEMVNSFREEVSEISDDDEEEEGDEEKPKKVKKKP